MHSIQRCAHFPPSRAHTPSPSSSSLEAAASGEGVGLGTGPLHTPLGAVLQKGPPELILEKRLLLTIHQLG